MQSIKRPYVLRFSKSHAAPVCEMTESKNKRDVHHSWFAQAEARAESAARIGFVLTMIFFAATALYAASLSGRSNPKIAAILDGIDGSIRDTGLRIDDLALSGVKNTPSQTIMATLELPYAGSILSYDTQKVRNSLMRIGWIEAAEVRRILPSRLEVTITERTPYARYASQGKTYVIDNKGLILGEDTEDKMRDLLLVSGDGAPSQAASLKDALQDRTSLMEKIERADLVAERFWALRLVGDLTVKLPRKVGPLQLERLESILAAQKVNEMAPKVIDLRLPHRTVLQLRDATVSNRERFIASLVTPPAAFASPAANSGTALPSKRVKVP